MGGSSSAPTPPDPAQTASTQAALNTSAGEQSQQGSMVNQNIQGLGGLSYVQSGTGAGGVPLYTANTTLSTPEAQILSGLQGGQILAGSQGNNLLAGANYGSQSPADVIGGATSGNTQAMLGQLTSYMNPYFQQSTEQLDSTLRNQGHNPGDPAYDNAMQNLQKSQGATITGALPQLESTAYSQAAQNYMMPLTMGLQEYGFAQPGLPGSQFVQAPGLSVSPPNYEGDVQNAYQDQMQAYQSNLQQQQAMMTGLFGLGSAGIGGLTKGMGGAGGAGLTTALALAPLGA
jgi:hypothetical protein